MELFVMRIVGRPRPNPDTPAEAEQDTVAEAELDTPADAEQDTPPRQRVTFAAEPTEETQQEEERKCKCKCKWTDFLKCGETPLCVFYFAITMIIMLFVFLGFFRLWILFTANPVSELHSHTLNRPKRYAFTGPPPAFYAWKPRRTWTDSCAKGVNLTVPQGQSATMKIDFCSRTSCPDKNSLLWPDFYMCISALYQYCPTCRNWKDAWWTTAHTDWGYGKSSPLKRRITIWKAVSGQGGPQLMFRINAAQQDTDQGYFVLCAQVSGPDPCISIFLAVPPVASEVPSSSAAIFIPLSVSTYHPVLPVADSQDEQETAVITGNRWYEVLRQIVNVAGMNTSCYACTLFPRDNMGAMPVKPHPLSVLETACSLLALTPPFQKKDNWWNMSSAALPNECASFRNVTIRVSTGDKLKTHSMDLYAPLGSVHPDHLTVRHPVCFRRELTSSRVLLGHTTGCIRTFNSTPCDRPPCRHTRAEGQVNLTATFNLSFAAMAVWPGDKGAGTLRENLWMCGNHYHQGLPRDWAGTCALVELRPAVTILDQLVHTTHHYPSYNPSKSLLREKREQKFISRGMKFLGAIFPWYGTINNAHHIDSIHLELENLTSLVTGSFSALNPYIAASRNMLTQHQMALDLLFASQGGLCHVIGDSCCTYLPDPTGNISDTIQHLNSLLDNMKKEETSQPSEWNWWDWFTGSGWRAWVARLIVPAVLILVVIMFFTSCVVPMVRKCISSMFSNLFYSHIHEYALVSQEDQDSGV